MTDRNKMIIEFQKTDVDGTPVFPKNGKTVMCTIPQLEPHFYNYDLCCIHHCVKAPILHGLLYKFFRFWCV